MTVQEGKVFFYSDGQMQKTYAIRIKQGLAQPGWTGAFASIPIDHIGQTVRAQIQNPHTKVWSDWIDFLVVDTSQTTKKMQANGLFESDQDRHIRENLVLECDYQTAQRTGFVDEGKALARVEINGGARVDTTIVATAAYTPPKIVDVIDKLPHAHPENVTHKNVAGTKILAVHYSAERTRPGYDELAYMIGEANFHIQKNWGRAGYPPVYGFGLMYHYQISQTGVLYRTQPENLLTWNATNANPIDIACCCQLGAGEKPSEAMLNTLQAYLVWMTRHRPDFPAGQADVWGHGELVSYGNKTACPGAILPYVKRFRATGRLRP